MLGEAIALAVALSGALKYEGVFTFQTKGDGPIRLMVADVTTSGAIRGYAQFDPAKLEQLGQDAVSSVPRLLGAGYLALTVDQGEHTERYQGIVALEGATLAECVHHYFRQSEQVEAGLKVAVARVALPAGGKAWRAGALMSTSTAGELLDPGLPPAELLFRLFHEEGVRAYKPHDLAARCRCSRDRVERMLKALGVRELEDLKVDGRLVVTCEFCSASYVYDEEEIAALAPP